MVGKPKIEKRLPIVNYGKKYKAYSNGEEETEHFQIAYDPEGEEYIITSETGFETSSKNLTQAIKDTMEDVEDFANEFCNDLDLEPESLSFVIPRLHLIDRTKLRSSTTLSLLNVIMERQ